MSINRLVSLIFRMITRNEPVSLYKIGPLILYHRGARVVANTGVSHYVHYGHWPTCKPIVDLNELHLYVSLPTIKPL